MAGIGAEKPTLLDIASRMGADGKVEKTIIELLNQSNQAIDDMVMLEANDGSSHKTTVRTDIPNGTWRKLNYGVKPKKSLTAQVKDSAGMLENYAEVDKSLADLNGNTAVWRASEDAPFLEGMNQDFLDTLFYGNTAINPERFLGFAPRFAAKAGQANGDNILLGGGAGSDNTSIWLVGWAPTTVHAFYPKGSKAGLFHKDLGEQTLFDGDGGQYQGYRTHYKWDVGLSVRDWRYVVRIANIDVSELTKNASAGADLIDLMVQALELIPQEGIARLAFYGNRTVRSFLRRQITNKSNVHLSMDEIAGKRVLAFDGVPFRRVDALLNTEAAVV